jgi:transcriptional regulator with XRE-family HTH domain
MPSRSQQSGFEKYRVGAKVRRLRLRKKISLEELGRHTGLSPALISKLERDQVMPTLPTLMRIAPVFGIGLDEFFVTEPPGAVVTRARERLRFPEVQGDEQSPYEFESLDYPADRREMNAYLAEFRHTGRPVRPHVHDAAEFLYLITGQLLVQVDGIDHLLEAGDSMYIRATVPHGYVNPAVEPSIAVVVTAGGAAATSYETKR